jgi:VanZ family protein
MKFTSFIPGITWFLISTFLLTIPGNDLPHSPLFDFPFFDKLVHLGMFFLLAALFCYPFSLINHDASTIKSHFVIVALLVIAYGIAMEFVQKYFVVGRSFDLADILFDGLGSFAGMLALTLWYLKK